VTDLHAVGIALDRHLVEREGLRGFVRRAWHIVEPNEYRASWHIDVICDHLEALLAGDILDLCICQPPGTSKSLIASTLFPAYCWIRKPALRIISSSYAQGIAEKNSKMHRDLVASDWFQSRWGGARIGKDDLNKVRLFTNEALGWRFTTSVGGEATGRHADLLIGDDLVKVQDVTGAYIVEPEAIARANEFWFGTMRTRRADPLTTRRLLIGQRLHSDDAPGRAIEEGYTALVLPMEYDARIASTTDRRKDPGELLVPDRFPRSVVDADKARMPPRDYAAQFQQSPTSATGSIFKNVGAKRWATLPKNGRTIITVDATFKDSKTSDFVAIQVWHGDHPRFYLLEEHAERLSFSRTVDRIRQVKANFPIAAIYIEDKANGPAIIDTLKDLVTGVLAWSPGTASKISRAEAKAHLFEAGNVLLPEGDLEAYISELHKFPRGKHDDRVDGTTMALMILDAQGTANYAAFVRGLRR